MNRFFEHKIINKVFSLVFIICFYNSNAATFQNGETVFNLNRIHEIRLTFSQPHYWDTLVIRHSASHDSLSADEEELMANVQIDGIKIDSIGVKLKSYLSYTIPSGKKPIKLHFNSFVKTKSFDGLHRLNLSNEFPDPSMLRNTVAFNILRHAGVRAPRTSFAKVYVNEKYVGLYVLIEQVDREFLNNYFKSAGSDLIKPVSSSLSWFGDDDVFSFSKNFEVKTHDSAIAISRLFSFTKKINTTPASVFYDSLKNIFDFNSYIPVLAADIIFNNWDSYFYGQNYYLYRDSSENKYYYLPWDYNVSLNNYEVSGGDYSILPGGKNDNIFELPLPTKIINNKKLRKDYLDKLYRINQYLSEDSLKTFIYEMHDLIRPALQTDSGKVFTMDQYEHSLSQRVSISDIEFEGLLSFIKYRHEQVAKMIDDAKMERR